MQGECVNLKIQTTEIGEHNWKIEATIGHIMFVQHGQTKDEAWMNLVGEMTVFCRGVDCVIRYLNRRPPENDKTGGL